MQLFDDIDRTIITLLAENPDLSQSELGSILQISQPAIGTRIHKLTEQELIKHQIGVNLTKTKTGIAKIDATAKDSAQILDTFKETCPLFINGFVTSGRRNLTLLLLFEDLSTLNACIDCHLRNDANVTELELSIIVSSAKDVVVPLKLTKRNHVKAPCGKNCTECLRYNSESCLGCPNTQHYRGLLFG